MSQIAKILVVDDNPVVLLKTSRLLEKEGYDVSQASGGQEALDVVARERPHLVLLDVMLPDINGLEVCKRIKADASCGSVFVVMLSTSEISSTKQASGLDAGADGYITRPIENLELLARVQAILRIQRAEAKLQVANDELEQRVSERTAELSSANDSLIMEIGERRRAEEARRQYAERLVDVQETERRFIAHELHDQIGQELTGLKMLLNRTADKHPDLRQNGLGEAEGMIDSLMGRVRQLSLDLRPQILDDLGLHAALEWYFERYFEQTGIRVDFKSVVLDERLESRIETTIFRIVQEALTNIARHAKVESAAVRFWRDDESVRVQIMDEGEGFDSEAALASHTSTGLSGMRERAGLLGGEFVLESAAGSGAQITVELPLRNARPTSAEPGSVENESES